MKTVVHLFKQLYSCASWLISPPFCTYCRDFISERVPLCHGCIARVRPVVTTMLFVTPSWQVKVFAASAYEDPIAPLVLAKSYRNRLAGYQIGQLAWQLTDVARVPFDVIVPIPLHWRRRVYRGYNQVDEMARAVSHESKKPVVQALKRLKFSPFQSRVAGDERGENVQGAFALQKGYEKDIAEKHILLVDDLMASGETLKAAVHALKKADPARITVLVACRVC